MVNVVIPGLAALPLLGCAANRRPLSPSSEAGKEVRGT
jgi:hypothetical protein